MIKYLNRYDFFGNPLSKIFQLTHREIHWSSLKFKRSKGTFHQVDSVCQSKSLYIKVAITLKNQIRNDFYHADIIDNNMLLLYNMKLKNYRLIISFSAPNLEKRPLTPTLSVPSNSPNWSKNQQNKNSLAPGKTPLAARKSLGVEVEFKLFTTNSLAPIQDQIRKLSLR